MLQQGNKPKGKNVANHRRRATTTSNFQDTASRAIICHNIIMENGEPHKTTHLKVLPKFPTSSLLLPSRSTIVRQIGVGIIVEKSWHDNYYY
jgi:hypothetical protein